MKNILTAATLASLAAGGLFAQNGIPDLAIRAQVGFESEHVDKGKEHSDTNIQTTVIAEYAVPQVQGLTIYGKVFSMEPIRQTANQFDWNLGLKGDIEGFILDGGWTFHTYPNNASVGGKIPAAAWNVETNRGDYNRSNEIYIGVAKELDYGFKPAVYFFYDFNLEQLTSEASVSYTWNGIDVGIPDFSIIAKAYAGYVMAGQYNGDQRSGADKWRNDYGYLGFSLDGAYQITNYTQVGVGMRYAWNNDNSSFDIPGNTDSNIWWGCWLKFQY